MVGTRNPSSCLSARELPVPFALSLAPHSPGPPAPAEHPSLKEPLMTSNARPVHDHDRTAAHHSTADDDALLAIAGAFFVILGVALAMRGWPSPTSGSPMFLQAGVDLVLSGLLIAKRSPIGLLTYLAVLPVVLLGALRNIGGGGSSLSFRLLGPALLLAMIGILLPAIARRPWRHALIGAPLIIGASLALSLTVGAGGKVARPGTAEAER